MPTRPAYPPLDPEAGPLWRSALDTFFGGEVVLTHDNLDLLRTANSLAAEALLTSHGFEEQEVTVPGPGGPLTASIFTPVSAVTAGGTRPGIYWIHGGGMVAGDRYQAVEAILLGEAIGGVVMSIEYRFAPEHPSPASGDDCYAGLAWFLEHAADFGVDPAAVFVGGASAGGGLAAGTALHLRDSGGASLAGLILCCPMLDDRMTSVSSRQFQNDIVWTRPSNEFGWSALLGERYGTDDVTIYEAPGRATDLSGLPPTLIDVGSVDLFRDEDVAFASAIWAAGGDAELHVWPGGYHGFEMFAPESVLSKVALETRRQWILRRVAHLGLVR
ncbi:MAG: alpha/beta hydrolase [Chloroflexota bacterium]